MFSPETFIRIIMNGQTSGKVMIFRISYMKQKMLTIEIVLTDLLYANINFGAGLQSLSRFFFFSSLTSP